MCKFELLIINRILFYEYAESLGDGLFSLTDVECRRSMVWGQSYRNILDNFTSKCLSRVAFDGRVEADLTASRYVAKRESFRDVLHLLILPLIMTVTI